MPLWLVDMEARATSAQVEVEAETSEEAQEKAREVGFERNDWFELTDFVAGRAKNVDAG